MTPQAPDSPTTPPASRIPPVGKGVDASGTTGIIAIVALIVAIAMPSAMHGR